MAGSETLDDCLRCNRLVTYKGTLIGHLHWICACVLCVLCRDPKEDIVMEKAILPIATTVALSCQTFPLTQETLCVYAKHLPYPRNFGIASKIFALSFKLYGGQL